MSVNMVQHFEYTCKFITAFSLDNHFIFSTDAGLLIAELQSDIFRSSADYKVLRTWLSFSNVKPFEDKNFKRIRFQRPVFCCENNLTSIKNHQNWNVIYLTNSGSIVFLDKQNGKWIEKLSEIPQKWFLHLSKDADGVCNLKKNYTKDNRILMYCREREKNLHIKNFVNTHLLKKVDGNNYYGTICCHVNNTLTFWSSFYEKSTFLETFDFYTSSIKYIKWFRISNDLSWLLVFLNNGQVYVHEFVVYPTVHRTFVLWSDEDFSIVKHILIEQYPDGQCLILLTKMAFVLIILYSLTEQKIVTIKKEMIQKTSTIPGLTFLAKKDMLILVTDSGQFVSMCLTVSDNNVTYSMKPLNNNFIEQVENFTCTSVVFSQNKCTCVLAFESNLPRYSKNDGHIKNKLLFCMIPEDLVELEQKILSVTNGSYINVIDCIETLRVNRMNDSSKEELQLDRKALDTHSVEFLKLMYWKFAFKNKKTNYEENLLSELQILIHVRFLTDRLIDNKTSTTNAERYYIRVMFIEYLKKLPVDYESVRTDAANIVSSLAEAKHTHFCCTCQHIILSLTDFRMFSCEKNHTELRCPVTLESLGMPYLVCSMCFSMANIKSSNQKCVWCFGKYIQNELLYYM
ncbi:uncharacterized protein LOC126840518 isoform X1 [Adelges cooleyi]|uniref:uncharacterized protein LOC126840518 isoform X1 n=1 Tax=Adelges cooleyi TaxID=133065 RepID=UPI00217F80B0|nr:uncharacterized protein LOC126840518 isoform X1 [Adelges cooleyi]